MTDKEKLIKIKSLADKMYYAAFNLTTDASLLRKAMKEYHQFIIHEYCKEEPVSEGRDIFDKCLKGEEKFILPQKISGNIDCENCLYSSACALGDIQTCIIDKPVSEDLEETADKYESEQQEKYKDKDNHDFDNYRDGFVDGLTHTYDAFKAGAKWQKEQMIAKAIDAHVNYAWSGLSFGGFDWSKTGLDLGDKCKLIIIKED